MGMLTGTQNRLALEKRNRFIDRLCRCSPVVWRLPSGDRAVGFAEIPADAGLFTLPGFHPFCNPSCEVKPFSPATAMSGFGVEGAEAITSAKLSF
jgi:hypothetical protein